jgi:hypothetical protein
MIDHSMHGPAVEREKRFKFSAPGDYRVTAGKVGWRNP